MVAEGGTGNAQNVTGVPVTWSSTGYDPYAPTQTVQGTLNLSRFPQLSGENIPNLTATVNLTYGTVEIPMASLVSSSAHELTVSAIPGAEYSIDGGATWQTGNTFSGLDADKSYTILVRMAEDENYTASGTRPVSGRTTDTPVNILDTHAHSDGGRRYSNRQL